MKTALITLLLFSSSAFALEKVKIDGQFYIPKGFDNNDLVEVTVVGSLPTSCHRNPFFEVERKDNQYNIRLFAHYVPQPEGCRKVAMAYSETINFGLMNEGEYELSLVNKKSTFHQKLAVKNASNQLVDEFLYGNVTGVSENDADRTIELTGVNPLNCMVFEKLSAEVQDSLIVLRPQFKEVGFCENKPTPFKINYTVPYLETAPKGVLIHVRVMNGRSHNYLFQNRL